MTLLEIVKSLEAFLWPLGELDNGRGGTMTAARMTGFTSWATRLCCSTQRVSSIHLHLIFNLRQESRKWRCLLPCFKTAGALWAAGYWFLGPSFQEEDTGYSWLGRCFCASAESYAWFHSSWSRRQILEKGASLGNLFCHVVWDVVRSLVVDREVLIRSKT